MDEYTLAPGEALLLKTCGIYRDEKVTGLKAIMNSEPACGDLCLTTENVVFTWETGTFIKKNTSIVFPLSKIKIHGGLVQVKASKPNTTGDKYHLTFYLANSKEEFLFQSSDKKLLKSWVESVNEAVTGERGGFDPDDIGSMQVGKRILNALEAVKPITNEVAEVAKPLMPIAVAVAGSRSETAGNIAGAILDSAKMFAVKKEEPMLGLNAASDKTLASKPQETASTNNASSELSLNEQIEALTKLKSLVDAGILTEEEFTSKKKHIIGL